MGRFTFVARRILQTVPLLLAVVFVVFVLLEVAPGDPAQVVAGQRATPAQLQEARERLGLDRPFVVRYVVYLSNVVQGDLGASIRSFQPVTEVISERLPVTLWLLAAGTLISLLLSVPLGVIAARHTDRLADHTVRAISLVGLTLPTYWVGILLLQFVALPTGWFPVGGFGETVPDHVRAVILPGLALALSIAPVQIRSLRTSTIGVLESDYVATARSLGIGGTRLVRRHVLRNAIPPTLTLLAVQVGFLFFGAVVVESVFTLPGLGQGMVNAVLSRDFPVVQGITLVFALGVVAVHLAHDIAYALLDPRVEIQ